MTPSSPYLGGNKAEGRPDEKTFLVIRKSLFGKTNKAFRSYEKGFFVSPSLCFVGQKIRVRPSHRALSCRCRYEKRRIPGPGVRLKESMLCQSCFLFSASGVPASAGLHVIVADGACRLLYRSLQFAEPIADTEAEAHLRIPVPRIADEARAFDV